MFKRHSGNKIDQAFARMKRQRFQVNARRYGDGSDILYTKDRMLPIWRGAQDNEQPVFNLEHALRAVGMESRVRATRCKQAPQASEDCRAQRAIISQLSLQFGQIQLLAVDGAVPAGELYPCAPAARAEQAVEVNPWHAYQCKHDGVGSHKALDLAPEGLVRFGVREGVKIIDVELVRALAAIRVRAVRDLPAMRQSSLHQ